jgi:hypothetical protein
MAPVLADEGGQLAQAKVIALTQHEKRLVAASFLAHIASALFALLFVVVFMGILLVVIIQVTSLIFPGHFKTDNQQIDNLTNFTPFILECFFTGLSFIGSCAIFYMWRRLIFVYSLLVSLSLLAAAAVVSFGTFISLNGIVPALLAWRILSDGFRLATTPDNTRELFVAIDPSQQGIKQTFAAALGIPPICSSLSPFRRRLLARTLFVLVAIAQGITIFVVIVSLFSGPLWGLLLAAFSGGILSVVTGLLRKLARRYARISAEKLTQADKRAAILFLRSFDEDQVSLDIPKRGFLRALLGLGTPLPTLDHLLVEEFTALGPVVAIGVPGAPTPFGAARTYVDDGEWRNVVAALARDASAIVMMVDDTEGVQWELSHVVGSGHLPKTLFLLPARFKLPPDELRSVFEKFPNRADFATHLAAADRERAAPFVSRALLDNQSVLSEPLTESCIGWYLTSDHEMVLLVSNRPNEASYTCALRLFHRRNQIKPFLRGPNMVR